MLGLIGGIEQKQYSRYIIRTHSVGFEGKQMGTTAGRKYKAALLKSEGWHHPGRDEGAFWGGRRTRVTEALSQLVPEPEGHAALEPLQAEGRAC